MSFDDHFDNSKLASVLKKAKTLSKEECRAIYSYMETHRPKTILEFGVQFGCSTRAFLEMSEWLGLDINLHSWDIVDVIKKACVQRDQFTFHKEDITGKEEEVILKHKPDMIFLDAHPYYMTKALMQVCLKHKINFLTHDVAYRLYEALGKRSQNFQNKDEYGAWELYILAELFSQNLLTDDSYEDDRVRITCIRDEWGLAIVEVK